MTQPLASRRIVFQGLSALGVATCWPGAAATTSRRRQRHDRAIEPDRVEPVGAAARAPRRRAGRSPRASAALATTDEIPVGGGIVLMDERIVIVQPTAGEFVAWSAICTHEGKTVGSVEDNVINCPCHGSQYSIGDRRRRRRPGALPAGRGQITVTGAGSRWRDLTAAGRGTLPARLVARRVPAVEPRRRAPRAPRRTGRPGPGRDPGLLDELALGVRATEPAARRGQGGRASARLDVRVRRPAGQRPGQRSHDLALGRVRRAAAAQRPSARARPGRRGPAG